MLFMNIARKFGAVYQEEAGSETGSPAAAAPATEAPAPTEEAKPAPTEPTRIATDDKPEEKPADAGDVKASIAAFAAEYAADKPALGLALNFLGDAGIAPTDPAFQAAQSGDFTLLKAVLAQKGIAGTDQMVAILEKEVNASIEEQTAFEAKTTEMVNGILGEQSAEILDWARQNATPEEKTAMNEMLAAGGFYARAAAMMLRDAWVGGDTTQPAQNAVQVSTTGGGGNQPMSAREYADAVQELAKELGGDPRGSAKYQQLGARRAAGRARGI